ncbi:MAG: PDZ domain-containing protein [Pyrinomonadaceae bacterium]|nr:PDZ domain-containing protein [Pyrinomonadaceae bacterium]
MAFVFRRSQRLVVKIVRCRFVKLRRFLERSLALCMLFLACASHLTSAQQQNHQAFASATRASSLATFDDVWQTINDRYYDPSLHETDWQGLRATFRPSAASARDSKELYALMRRMLLSLRDPHTRLYAPGEEFDTERPRFVTTGLSLREVDGLVVVWRVERNSPAARAKVRAGDVVTSIDGEPVTDFLNRRLAEGQSASRSETARFQAVARLLDGANDSLVTVDFVRPDNRAYTVQLRRLKGARDLHLQLRSAHKGSISIIRLDAFTSLTAAEFGRVLESLSAAQGIVLDLRDNGGGESEAMLDVLSAFVPANSTIGRFIDRNGRIITELQTRSAMLSSAARIVQLAQPLIILTSPKTASAAEIFVAALRERVRARVLGENTCGCVLGTRGAHKLPDGGALVFSEMNYHTTAGARLEGAGLAPDELIKISRRDLQTNRDPLLERATDLLRQK